MQYMYTLTILVLHPNLYRLHVGILSPNWTKSEKGREKRYGREGKEKMRWGEES